MNKRHNIIKIDKIDMDHIYENTVIKNEVLLDSFSGKSIIKYNFHFLFRKDFNEKLFEHLEYKSSNSEKVYLIFIEKGNVMYAGDLSIISFEYSFNMKYAYDMCYLSLSGTETLNQR